jgi:hypothetical protein
MALQHLRSSTADKRATPGAMADGQLAMNTNLASPGLFFKDSNGDLVKTGPVHVGTTAPNATPASGGQAGNSKGELWLDTTGSDYTLKTWDGSAWREIVVTSTMIKDGTIVNADVNASAAIAGTKVAPDFGSQTIATTGVFRHALGAAATPSVTFTGDLNTGIFSPGADQLAISTNGTGRLFIDSSGRALIGTSSSISNLYRAGTSAVSPTLQIENATNSYNSGYSDINYSASGFAPVLTLGLSKSNTRGTNTIVASGDELGYIHFVGADGTNFRSAAWIRGEVDGTPGSADMPGRLVFSTTADNAASPTERMRLDSTGRLGLGTSSPQTALHVTSTGLTINTGTNCGRIYGNTTNKLGFTFSSADGSAVSPDKAQLVLISDNTSSRAQFLIGLTHSASTPSYSFIDDPNTGIVGGVSASPDVLGINTGGVRALTVDASQRVGIGTTTPNESLEVAGNIHVSGADRSIFNRSNNALTFGTNNAERARIDSSGRLLVGTSSTRTVEPDANTTSGYVPHAIEAVTSGLGFLVLCQNAASTNVGSGILLARTRDASVGGNTLVNNNDTLGTISFAGADGTDIRTKAAAIFAQVDGTPGANNMPGRLVMSVTLDGASTPTEAFRITNDRVRAYNQAAPAAVNATATLTAANLKTGIITSTSAAATDMTLPTGTDTEGGFSGIYTNMTFEWSVINTGPSLVTVLANTAHTLVGSGAVATGTSARFASRRTASNTFVSYRLS